MEHSTPELMPRTPCTPCAADPARDAFEEAVKIISSTTGIHSATTIFASSHNDISSVQKAIADAQKSYQQRFGSKARKWLVRLSTRIHTYGKILDVLVQHHPEYVSLAWGTFKLLFTGVVNHEELTKELAKAFCKIADALPEAEDDLRLYPYDSMKDLVALLYASIITFARRAVEWYQEGRLKHAFSALVRPYTLRFKDIVQDISEVSRKIEKLAHKAELRHARMELRENTKELQQLRQEQKKIQDLVNDMRSFLEQHHSLQQSGLVDTSQKISQIQLSQILSFTATSSLRPPEESRRYYFPKRLRRFNYATQFETIQDAPQLQSWSSNPVSSQLALSVGSPECKKAVKCFTVEAIEMISKAKIPVVWALPFQADSSSGHISADVLKSLVSQILQSNVSLHNERAASLSAVRFQSARTDQEWFNLLASVLHGLPQIYILIDLSVLNYDSDTEQAWPALFDTIFQNLDNRRLCTVVKVLFICQSTKEKRKLGYAKVPDILHVSHLRPSGVTKTYKTQVGFGRRDQGSHVFKKTRGPARRLR